MKLSSSVRSLTGKILCPSIELSLTLSLLGGQSFRWKQINDETPGNNRFQGVFSNRVWTLWSDPSFLHYEVHSQDPDLDAASAERILREYFRLDQALPDLYAEWSRRDAFFKQTCGQFVGIRMLNQDLVENLFSFLCSSNNNIARISGMIDKMCTEYGTLICTLDQTKQTEHIKTDDVKTSFEICKSEPIDETESDTKTTRISKRSTRAVKHTDVTDSEQSVLNTRSAEKSRVAKIDRSIKVEMDEELQVKRGGKNVKLPKNASSVKPVIDNTESGSTVGSVAKSESTYVRFHAFPTIQALAKPAVEAKLRLLGFGYRAKFIQKSAEYIEENGGTQWLEELKNMNYEEARAELQKLPGIGAKVADCICLMSLSHLQSVPVDTHVYQIAVNHYSYPKLPTKTLTALAYNQIRSFFIEKFGNYAGWAHSILFCADLKRFQTTSTTVQSNDSKPSKGKGLKRKASH